MLRKRSLLIQHYSDVDCGPEKNCKNSWNHLTMRHDGSQCSGVSGGKSFCSAYIFVDLRQWSGNVDVVKIMNETRDTIPRTCSSTSHIIIPCPPSSSKFLLVSGSAASSPSSQQMSVLSSPTMRQHWNNFQISNSFHQRWRIIWKMSEKQYKTFESGCDKDPGLRSSWLSATCYRWWWVLHTCIAACLDTCWSCCESEVVW